MFYDIDKRINKKVWVFETEGHILPKLNQDKVWTIVSLHEPDETMDDFYYTISDGNESRNVLWYRVVVTPDNTRNETDRIYTYLHDNGFYDDGVWCKRVLDTQLIYIAKDWGDWKHDHGWLDDLMSHLGYDCLNTIVTEENGSDCYSAEHIFIHKKNPRYELMMNARKLFA